MDFDSTPFFLIRRMDGVIYTSDQLSVGPHRQIVAGGTRAQTRAAVEAISEVQAVHGAGSNHVVKTTVWLTNAEDFQELNEVYAAAFSQPYPARSTVISTRMINGAGRDRGSCAQTQAGASIK